MCQQITVYENEQFGQIRTIGNADNPMFCLNDVCKVLEINNPRDAKTRLKQDGVVLTDIGVVTGKKKDGTDAVQSLPTTFINEQNLYRLIMRSDKPQAEPFQDWVCGEVLPAIRKSGGYMVAQPEETPEQVMARALKIADDTIKRTKMELKEVKSKNALLADKNESLERQNNHLRKDQDRLMPSVVFAKAVETSKQSILIGELAKLITQQGYEEIGQNRLFEWMRKNGYLISACNDMYNQPTQKAMKLGLFEIKKTVIQKPDGEILVKTTPKVTGKGQIYFLNHFIFDGINKKYEKKGDKK